MYGVYACEGSDNQHPEDGSSGKGPGTPNFEFLQCDEAEIYLLERD